jgi:PIN domain nuclease of toxin-antitoxin system
VITIAGIRSNVSIAEIRPLPRPPKAQRRNAVFLSALSAWEITIKHRLGRLPLPEPPWALGVEPLPFDETAAMRDALLPAHERDTVDRGLVARAILHGLSVTPDPEIGRYPAPTFWQTPGAEPAISRRPSPLVRRRT